METENLIAAIEKVVGEINEDIFEIVDNDEFMDEFPIEIECISNGHSTAVIFLGFRIWSSEDDERLFMPNTKEESREPIRNYLAKEVNRIIKQITLIGRISTN